MPRDEEQPLLFGQFASQILIQDPSLGCQQDSRSRSRVFGLDSFHGIEHWLRHEDHSGSAAEGFIIDFPMLIKGVISNIGTDDFDAPFFPCTSDNTISEKGVDLFRK